MDRTLDIIHKTWDEKIPIKIIHRQKNAGEWNNVNLALRDIDGSADWVLKLHADNPLKPHWLKTMLGQIERCPDYVATISSSWDNVYADGTVVAGEDNIEREPEIIPGGIKPLLRTLQKGCWWHNSGCAVRITAYKDIGEFEPRWKQKGDWEWLLRCLYKGWGVMYIPRTLFYYTQFDGTLSFKNIQNDTDLRESLQIFQKYLHITPIIDIFRIHLDYIYFMCRRFVRALLKLNIYRVIYVISSATFILGSLIKCVLSKWKRI
jgi:hypothetical protein